MISDAPEPSGDSTAPKRENLEKAFGMLKGDLNKAKALAALGGRRKKIDPNAPKNCFCPVCNSMFSTTGLVVHDALKSKVCLSCQLKFDEGMAACVGKNRKLFWVYSGALVPTPEQLAQTGGYPIFADLSDETMAALEKKFQQQAKIADETQEEGNG